MRVRHLRGWKAWVRWRVNDVVASEQAGMEVKRTRFEANVNKLSSFASWEILSMSVDIVNTCRDRREGELSRTIILCAALVLFIS